MESTTIRANVVWIGQYNSVIQFEYTAIRDACSKHYKGKQTAPNISIIVCGKRHHTRFYPASPELAKTTDGRTSNPVPGTMVDRTVTSPRDW